MINRSAIVLRPTQRFVDWAAGLDASGLLPNPNGERYVYLIPVYYDDAELNAILEEVYAAMFENELYGWHTDRSAWPKDRDLATFREWFKIEVHSIVEDLCSDEIVDEDIDIDADD